MHGDRLAAATKLVQGQAQAVEEHHPIGQASEGVVIGETRRPGLAGDHALRHAQAAPIEQAGQQHEAADHQQDRRDQALRQRPAGLVRAPAESRDPPALVVAHQDVGFAW